MGKNIAKLRCSLPACERTLDNHIVIAEKSRLMTFWEAIIS